MESLEIKPNMLAYCGQCSFKVAHDEDDSKHLVDIPYGFILKNLSEYDCDGCKGNHCICGNCKIKPCAIVKNIENCAECAEFPCELIDAFSNDGMPHHRDAVDNLNATRQYGVEAWVENLRHTLKCRCGETLTWYYYCPAHRKHPDGY